MFCLPRIVRLSCSFDVSNSLVTNTDNTVSSKENGLSTIDVLTSNVDQLLFVSVNLFLRLSFETYVVAGVWSSFLQNLLLLEF
jgi:hypothetical protein